ncbi:unnamed protein product [Closterium sp. NIES-64]|nr:unnamed protein product [Closterium sp. NIES-64]
MFSHPTHLQSQESQPISLVYNDRNPHWSQTICFFLTRPGLHTFTSAFLTPSISPSRRLHHSQQPLPNVPPLEIQGTVVSFKGPESESWPLGFLKDCAQLQELSLGRGMWKLNWQCVNTARFKSIRKLTLEHVHYESMSFQFLEIITEQLHEYTLYEDGNSWPNGSSSPKSTAPLALHHLSLYGRERLDISSLRLASTRFLFFPSCKACNAPALAALRQDYPTLALYCVVDCSFYWERKGKTVSNGPLEHVRGEKSGVWDEEVWEMRPKKGREKMHSVNRKLVEGYSAEEDQVHVLQCQ